MADQLTWGYKDQLLLNITFWILIGVTLFGLLIRIYVRIHCRGSLFNWRSWRWSDIFLVLSWLGFLSSGLVNLIAFAHYGYVSSDWEKHVGEKRFYIVRKLNFVYNITFWPWLFLVKASLLCFFNELITKQSHYKTWLTIRFVGLLVLLGFLSIIIYGVLWCQPISRQWATGDRFCWADFQNRYRMIVFRQVYHAVTDVMIVAIPLPLLPLLRNITARQRVGIAIMFALGLFSTISGIIFMLGVLQWDSNATLQTPAAIRYLQYEPPAELASAILIQCVPGMRAFWGVWRRRKKSVVEMGRGGGGGGMNQRPESGVSGMAGLVGKLEGKVDEEEDVGIKLEERKTNSLGPGAYSPGTRDALEGIDKSGSGGEGREGGEGLVRRDAEREQRVDEIV